MAHTQTTITAPVTTSDISAVLAVASNNVGYLCSDKHGKINRWSRYKPVILAELFPDRTEDWWKGGDGMCGLNPIYTTDYRNIPSFYTEGFIREGWVYHPPTGGAAAPFRMGDFDKYLHTALPPFRDFNCIEKACTGKLFHAGVACNIAGTTGSPTSITLADITDASGTYNSQSKRKTLADYYFGIIICKPDGSIYRRLTAENPGSEEIRIESFTASLVEGQTYKVYPFLSLKKIGIMDADIADNYLYPLPCVGPASFKAVSAEEYAGLIISISGKYTIGKSGAQVTVKVSSTKACSLWGTLYVRHTSTGEQTDVNDRSQIIAQESSKISVAANGTFEKTYIFNLSEEYYGQYIMHLVLRIDNVLYEKTGVLLMTS